MSKASEEDLGHLHGAVARLLTDVVDNGVVVGVNDEGPVRATAPAAYVVAALAMLKQNNITADPATNAALSDLERKLTAKRQDAKRSLSADALADAAFSLEKDLGPLMQ